jgi:predicted RNA methylase
VVTKANPVTPALVKDAVTPPLPSDDEFDRVYPDRIRALSALHWTPVAVAARAATMLVEAGATRILDVGSGVGKFCLVGAMVTPARFVGLERRNSLIDLAGKAAAELGISRVAFVHASVDQFRFEGFDGVYLYNPFFEQISRYLPQVDASVEHSAKQYRIFTEAVTAQLDTLAPGAAVVTYQGFGGLMPRSYRFMTDEPAGDDRLDLWVKG